MRYTISLTLASLVAFPVLAEVPKVVTDVAPVHSLVALVMGDLGKPVLLLDNGADPHDFQLRPSQAQAVATAELVVWVGPQMSPWLDRTLDGTGSEGAKLALLSAPGTVTRPYAETGEGQDHAEAEAGEGHGEHAEGEGHDEHAEGEGHEEHAEGEGHDDHAHDGADPHAWLDPDNAVVWLGLIAAELSRLDPANAATYAANAADATLAVATVDKEIASRLMSVRDRPFVVFHDALGYFTEHYGLSPAGAISPGDASSPGAQHLRDLTAKAAGTVCIFPEVNHDADLAVQMAEASGAKLGSALDPEGVGLDPGELLYQTMMQELADALATCLAP